jgi:hypothetical protein
MTSKFPDTPRRMQIDLKIINAMKYPFGTCLSSKVELISPFILFPNVPTSYPNTIRRCISNSLKNHT